MEMKDYLRGVYEARGYHVQEITDARALVATFRVKFSGRGPYGRKHIDIRESSVRSMLEHRPTEGACS